MNPFWEPELPKCVVCGKKFDFDRDVICRGEYALGGGSYRQMHDHCYDARQASDDAEPLYWPPENRDENRITVGFIEFCRQSKDD